MIGLYRNQRVKRLFRNGVVLTILLGLIIHPLYASSKTPIKSEKSTATKQKVIDKNRFKHKLVMNQTTKKGAKKTTKKPIYNSKSKDIVHGIHTKEKVISLTFDDGPEPNMTPKILALLKEHKIKATFFVIGSNCKKYPEILKQIDTEGHEIANHSYTHRAFNKLSNTAIAKELNETTAEMKKNKVTVTNWFRAPYGNLSPEQAKLVRELGYRTLHWNVDTRDWSGISDKEMMAIFRKQFKPGSVVLMHTLIGRKNKPSHLPNLLNKLIPEYQEKGYRFVTATELIDK